MFVSELRSLLTVYYRPPGKAESPWKLGMILSLKEFLEAASPATGMGETPELMKLSIQEEFSSSPQTQAREVQSG